MLFSVDLSQYQSRSVTPTVGKNQKEVTYILLFVSNLNTKCFASTRMKNCGLDHPAFHPFNYLFVFICYVYLSKKLVYRANQKYSIMN